MAEFSSGQFIDAPDLDPVTFGTGDFCWSALRTKTGWLRCGIGDVSRATYATLFAAIVPLLGTLTVTLASPGVFTLVAHGLVIGDRLYLTTTGALPTGLAANTIYYVVSTPTADTFTVSASEGGSAVNTSGSQSGVHSLRFCPFGLGDGSTTFGIPDAPGRGLVAAAGASGNADVRAMGQNDGAVLASRRFKHLHTRTQDVVLASHQHNLFDGSRGVDSNGITVPWDTGSTGGSGLAAGDRATSDISHTSGTAGTVATQPTFGPQTNAPTDGPASLVANLFIKT